MTDLFGFKGRMARLPFFGYSLLIYFMVAVMLVLGVLTLKAGVGILLILAALVVGVWSGFAIMIKRLHDLDMAGTHVIWIMLLQVAASAVGMAQPGLGLLLSLGCLGVQLWLLFAPGTPSENRYGSVPGLPTVQPPPLPLTA